jgi:DNA repair protein RecN (Recombination protein N)
MLSAISIRDIVLIEKLDLTLESGLTVLTGETGAGKSILLDSLGLALGARGDASLVRTGQTKGSVTASFNLPEAHTARHFLKAKDIDVEGDVVVRRVQNVDGGSRAQINEQPVSINTLRQLASLLIELHGQHADRALVDVGEHRRLVDAFGGHEPQARLVETHWREQEQAKSALDEHIALMARAEAEREYLEHAAEELRKLNPLPSEEQQLAEKRQLMMQSEQYSAAMDEAEAALSGDGQVSVKINAALRRLERRKEGAGGRLDMLCAALDRVLHEIDEAMRAMDDARRSFEFDPRELEASEERLFALRAAARKHKSTVDDLSVVRERFEKELTSLLDGGKMQVELQRSYEEAKVRFERESDKLSAARGKTAKLLDKAVMKELPALKLEKARFETTISIDAGKPGPHGIDRVEFTVAANPGTPLNPLMKVASGGELARFMLALKVVLASKGSAPVLIFDEIDTGVGGAVADAIGQRLARLGEGLQVIAVTHSPQVAARARYHMAITKVEDVKSKRMFTRVVPLVAQSRREEVARMLSGASVTDEARAAAEKLLVGRG